MNYTQRHVHIVDPYNYMNVVFCFRQVFIKIEILYIFYARVVCIWIQNTLRSKSCDPFFEKNLIMTYQYFNLRCFFQEITTNFLWLLELPSWTRWHVNPCQSTRSPGNVLSTERRVGALTETLYQISQDRHRSVGTRRGILTQLPRAREPERYKNHSHSVKLFPL